MAKKSNRDNTLEVKGIKYTILNNIIIGIQIVLLAASITCAVVTANRYNEIEFFNQKYLDLQESIAEMRDASDLLTDNCRQYVMTGRTQYAINYYKEINEDKRREASLENVHRLISDFKIEPTHYLDQALEMSNELATTELHAMALIYGTETEDSDIPTEIQNYSLSSDELALSMDSRKALSYKMVFNQTYSEEKLAIREYTDKAADEILASTMDYVTRSSKQYHTASITMKALLGAVVLNTIVIIVLLYYLLLIPIRKSIRAMQQDQEMEYSHSYEYNYLAHAFNTLYERNKQSNLKLKNSAEHDSLTGLLNRNGYEELKKYYCDATEQIVFIIIDIDDFKVVNDTYGHEIGDKVLVLVSDILQQSFRDTDYIVRYGGDEFIVIMTGNGCHNKAMIERKFEEINNALANNSIPDVPPISVSIGAALSDCGYSEGLFRQADAALYRTKEKGKCGYTLSS